MTTRLFEAFASFGARPRNRLRDRSAIATDGALVLGCSSPYFRHPGPGVLRYEDALSRDSIDRTSAALLGEHLTQARDGQLPVRMVVIAEADFGKPRTRIFARHDVIGRVVDFDGDKYAVDFKRLVVEPKAENNRKKRS